MVWQDPEETKYSLGDGYYRIYLTKGFNFSETKSWCDWSNPEGRATLCNIGQCFTYIVELLIGKLPIPPLENLPAHLHIKWEDYWNLVYSITTGDVEGAIGAFCEILAKNSEGIAYWIWQETTNQGAHIFMTTAAGILKKVSIVFDLLSYANDQGPFFWDLVFAPGTATYYITQKNGVIISSDENKPPEAEFTINPSSGSINTKFVFDASYTKDDKDNIKSLKFRWNWEADPIWDTDWLNEPIIQHSYDKNGSYIVMLEVKDSKGLIGSITHTVNVGGGINTASHIKLFRDGLPWDSNAMVLLIEELGFKLGKGANTYEVVTSSQMGSVPLIPGEDLVIISNDQEQKFYDNYSRNQIRFSNFVKSGGSMLWEACDEGWAEGSIVNAGIIFPGNIKTFFNLDTKNIIINPDLPLVKGLPKILTGNYASHEGFSNLPDGAIIYCRDTSGNPTLIEFNFGEGWLLFTGQPLEWGYDRLDDYTIGLLLERIISHFTKRNLPAGFAMSPKSSKSVNTKKSSYIVDNIKFLPTKWGTEKNFIKRP